MSRPVCVNCQRNMQFTRAGIVVQFDANSVGGAYEQWSGDEYVCDTCGAKVVARYGAQPMWRHHHGEDKRVKKPDVIIPERR